MAKISVLVCDECAGQVAVKHYLVKEGARRAGVDLCKEHGAWVEKLLASSLTTAQKGRAARSRVRKVTSMEEVDALKKS